MVDTEKRVIITAALPYSEAIPHLGNFVGSILPADVFYKYSKLAGYDSIFICGSDQHGTPIEIRALKEGVEPKEFADKVHKEIKHILERFGCSFTYYGKTDSDSNKRAVYEIFNALYKNGFINKVDSVMPYCNIDKRFLTDRYIEGVCPYCGFEGARGDQCDNCGHLLNPSELIRPYCGLCHNNEIEFKKTTNLAIALDKLQPEILEFVKGRMGSWSKNAANKTISYLEQGLEAREITRDMKWGFEVPLEGYKDKVFYVWFDAVIGYIGISMDWSDQWEQYWKGKDTKLIQFMGKDNIEFHTMMWPGILIGSDLGYVLPHTIYAYEYLTAKGLKFSKSRGVGLNMGNALEIAGSDYWRFALMYLAPESSDTDFTIALFVDIVNKIMNGKIGNYVHRVLTLLKNSGLKASELVEDEKSMDKVAVLTRKYAEDFEALKMREALRELVAIADIGNEMISSSKPWELIGKDGVKQGSEGRAKELLGGMVSIVRRMGVLMWPFAPDASSKILKRFGISEPRLSDLEKPLKELNLEGLGPVFSKLSDKQLKELERFEEDS
ncbi:methionine--tRNA ligase [Thermoplasmatales archaeon ARMAN]|uniref:methionine--tRNA ligase n=1 Tax=Candidatus Micrarchaeum sp. TaxID=2282148 RepID=UPI000B647E0D|nr:methionine--tRNA ligase [Candidatus Micrarchaeum sp.]OWP53937.1 MAG: methionine--tRNA ligase [Thermoplasmatales archaeon ARMAN]